MTEEEYARVIHTVWSRVEAHLSGLEDRARAADDARDAAAAKRQATFLAEQAAGARARFRDGFAASALEGLLSRGCGDAAAVEMAFDIADAMMAARDRREQ